MQNIKIPNHVGIIVDGNGRWAEEKGFKRSKGHEKGFINLQELVPYIYSKGVNYISAYLFSTENFSRSAKEVSFIMNLLTSKIKEILSFCTKNNIKAVVSGRKENLTKSIINTLNKLEEETKGNTKIFNICFNYGGKAEIIDATKKIIQDIKEEKLNINELGEQKYEEYLYQKLPPIDLLIRTSGEMRLSNFMLYQNAYAEFYFPKTYFPDFKKEDFDKALEEYTKRDRRFGGINNEDKNN